MAKYPKVSELLLKETIGTDGQSKTIAEAMIDGTISDAELIRLNIETTFPIQSKYLEPPHYTRIEAIDDFVKTLLPYLSDQALFNLTDRLCAIEIKNGTSAFRTSTLAKSMIRHEIERLSKQPGNIVLACLLYHVKKHVLPLMEEKWNSGDRVNFNKNIKAFISFNFRYNKLSDDILTEIEKVNLEHFILMADPTKSSFPASNLIQILRKEAEVDSEAAAKDAAAATTLSKKEKTEEDKGFVVSTPTLTTNPTATHYGQLTFFQSELASKTSALTQQKQSAVRERKEAHKELLSLQERIGKKKEEPNKEDIENYNNLLTNMSAKDHIITVVEEELKGIQKAEEKLVKSLIPSESPKGPFPSK